MKTKQNIKTILTPLRYPGGKSRAIKHLDQYFVKDFKSYHEPFIGGGSVFLYLKQFNPDAFYWINDKYYNLYCFWKELQSHGKDMVDFILSLRGRYNTPDKCKDLFIDIKDKIESSNDFEKACYFFILNKCSYSGLTETGTFSPLASESNFSISCIKYLLEVEKMLEGVKITNLDYSELLKGDGDFVFLDPPYDILKKNKNNALYGKNGEHHKLFDHDKFYQDVDKCESNWMITYNYSDTLLNRWKKYNLLEWKLKYGMQWDTDNQGKKTAKEKSELLITNYKK